MTDKDNIYTRYDKLYMKNTKGGKQMAGKNKALALVISFIFTGLGLVYLGDEKRGLILFGIAILLNCMGMWVTSIFSYLSLIIWLYGLYATYMMANEVC